MWCHVIALCLLDITAPFYTVDRRILLTKLERQFSLRGVVHALVQIVSLQQNFYSWICWPNISYCFRDMLSATRLSARSTPFCSFYFMYYTADLKDKVEEHQHAFADDTNLYVHCQCDQMLSTIQRLECCIDEIGHWMTGCV